jgi:hypothetical protein
MLRLVQILLLALVVGLAVPSCGSTSAGEENGNGENGNGENGNGENGNGENGNGENGNGEPPTCTEGERRCYDETRAERCNAEGDWDEVPCATSTVCDAGVCLAVVCEPGERRCGGAVTAEVCNELGTRWLAEACPEPGACIDDGECVSYTCWPNETRCANEETEETCASDGSGWIGALCAEGQRCLGSFCAFPVCEPGVTECDDDETVLHCRGDGSGFDAHTCPQPGACVEDTCVAYACEPGEQRCATDTMYETCASDGSGWIGSACDTDRLCSDGNCIVPVCEPRESRCVDAQTQEVCRADGSGWEIIACGDTASCEQGECVAEQLCDPGAPGCYDEITLGTCNDEGTAWLPGADCTGAEVCVDGTCSADPCATAVGTHLGCEFWPVVLPSPLPEKFRSYVAAVVTNPDNVVVDVTLYDPEGGILEETTVQPASSRTVYLPWNAMRPLETVSYDDLSLSRRGSIAYRLVTSRPVAVWQHNPLAMELASGCTSNDSCPRTDETCNLVTGVCSTSDRANTADAALLLPTHALGDQYVVTSLPHFQVDWELFPGFLTSRYDYPSLVAVTAISPGTTQVSFSLRGATAAGDGLVERDPGSSFDLSLDRHEVVQLASRAHGTASVSAVDEYTTRKEYPASDLTGTVITADKPIAIYIGAYCRNMPYSQGYCDHLSEQLLPRSAWGHRVVAGRSQPVGTTDYGDVWRIVAARDGTQLSFTPPTVHGAITLGAGQHVQLTTTESFVVTSQGSGYPILATQYLTGSQSHGGSVGDPSMITVPATAHYRSSHQVYVPSTYTQSYLTLAAEGTRTLTIDGTTVTPTWQQIGSSSARVARVPIAGGARRIEASGPIGITVYGHHSGASYGAPGGFSLAD